MCGVCGFVVLGVSVVLNVCVCVWGGVCGCGMGASKSLYSICGWVVLGVSVSDSESGCGWRGECMWVWYG